MLLEGSAIVGKELLDVGSGSVCSFKANVLWMDLLAQMTWEAEIPIGQKDK